jgi:hypothetical protein
VQKPENSPSSSIAAATPGSLAFVALFFSVDGTAVAARSPENCPVQQGANQKFRELGGIGCLRNLQKSPIFEDQHVSDF